MTASPTPTPGGRASDAIDAVDAMTAWPGCISIRQQLDQPRSAYRDDQAAARADQLLARHRDAINLPGAIRPGDTEGPGAEDTRAQRERES